MEVSRSWFVLVNKVMCFSFGGGSCLTKIFKVHGGGGGRKKKLPKSSTKKRWKKAGKPNKNKNKEIQKHDNRKKPTYIFLKTPFVNKKTPLYIKHLRRKPPKPQNNKKNPNTFQDNPVCRAAVAEALTDQRPLLSLFIFDPRFIDRDLEPFFSRNIGSKKSPFFVVSIEKDVGKNDCVFF